MSAKRNRVPAGVENQPVGKVEWIDRNELHGNDYNPNKVAPPELDLLKHSILEDGWTQPIVIRSNNEVVDGFHRWTISADPEIHALTGGLVPVVRLRDDVSEAHQKMSTIRHNRARGQHYVASMAEIVIDLVNAGEIDEKIARERLGMEPEELRRLRDKGEMVKRGAGQAGEYRAAWVPDPGA